MSLRADPAERLITQPESEGPAKPSLAPIILSALVHIFVLAVFLLEQMLVSIDIPTMEQEIPLEVVAEAPQPPQEQPQPEPEPEKEQPKPEEKEKQKPPPPQKLVDDEKPAFDAPRAPNQEKLDREAPDQETKSARREPPNEQRAAKPAQEKSADPRQQQAARAEPAPATPKAEEDKPDAEIVEQGQPQLEARLDDRRGDVEIKASPEPKPKSIADQLASLEPLPDFKLSGSSKPAPVSGGTAKTTYLSVLYGLIIPHLHVPPPLRNKTTPNHGVVVFFIDEGGHLTHQAVYRSSGFPELDNAALAAVRRAAPFPAPPYGHPRGIQFHFDPK
ncbi:cell envelope integrity protein TolA [Methylosinus sporium]|uniref:Energy transducer TonB n=1 Tax=Methylosinus sporium TaxID=428 RepID=A0A2U1STW3_METSR|nr:cell envelope integrity protein TolA [Methylosinus sporium]PWB95039.1 energy transducer TonB [Methylosinus sporium]